MTVVSVFAFIGTIGGWEVLVILFIILLLFGAKRIPDLARGLGKGIREFKDATNDIKDSIEKEASDIEKPKKKEEKQD